MRIPNKYFSVVFANALRIYDDTHFFAEVTSATLFYTTSVSRDSRPCNVCLTSTSIHGRFFPLFSEFVPTTMLRYHVVPGPSSFWDYRFCKLHKGLFFTPADTRSDRNWLLTGLIQTEPTANWVVENVEFYRAEHTLNRFWSWSRVKVMYNAGHF